MCEVSFLDVRGIRHGVEVEADSLYEAEVLAVQRFRKSPWIDQIGPATRLEIVAREPGSHHTITLQQIERWIAASSGTSSETLKKAKIETHAGRRITAGWTQSTSLASLAAQTPYPIDMNSHVWTMRKGDRLIRCELRALEAIA